MLTNAEELMEQAAKTAATWLRCATQEIDKQFGDGYAKKHPELVSGFIQAAALDQAGMYLRCIAQQLEHQNAFK